MENCLFCQTLQLNLWKLHFLQIMELLESLSLSQKTVDVLTERCLFDTCLLPVIAMYLFLLVALLCSYGSHLHGNYC